MFFARKRFDTRYPVLLGALARCLYAPDRDRSGAGILDSWGATALATLSVRSAFDLLLQSVDWEPGSEVAMTAVTIPHMAELVRLHGYVPVAIELAPETMFPSTAALEKALGPRTRAVVVAHLFGTRHDTAALRTIARQHGVMFIEDCAQCYSGRPEAPVGADVELYSFGSIKTATCLGGATALVADEALRRSMASIQARYAVQSTAGFAAKNAKSLLLTAVSGPVMYRHFRSVLDALWGDYDQVVRRLTRGFPEGELLARIRFQPSTALLAVMEKRFRCYDTGGLDARRDAGQLVAAQIGRTAAHLGGSGAQHTHWLFPVVARDPDRLVQAARAIGFDATTGASTLVALEGSSAMISDSMARVVYLPVYAGIPDRRLEALASLVSEELVAEQDERSEPPTTLAAA